MDKSFVKYKGKKYEIQEPTIEIWTRIMMLQEWSDEREFAVKLIAEITGLSIQEIEDADYEEVLSASQTISEYFIKDSSKFINEFEFNNKRYKFLDLPNLKFGEFIDIDSFLIKTEVERKRQMNLLMAMLYREVDEQGNYLPYDSKVLELKAEEFKKLPVKYLHGSSSFFLRIEKILQGNTTVSFWNRVKMMGKMTWVLVKLIVSVSFGLGLVHLSLLRMKILPKSMK